MQSRLSIKQLNGASGYEGGNTRVRDEGEVREKVSEDEGAKQGMETDNEGGMGHR